MPAVQYKVEELRGRIASFEFMVITSAIANLIRENKVFRISSSIQTGKKFGMQLLDEHLFKLFAQGKISPENAVEFSQHASLLHEKIEQFQKGQITHDATLNIPDDEPEKPSGSR